MNTIVKLTNKYSCNAHIYTMPTATEIEMLATAARDIAMNREVSIDLNGWTVAKVANYWDNKGDASDRVEIVINPPKDKLAVDAIGMDGAVHIARHGIEQNMTVQLSRGSIAAEEAAAASARKGAWMLNGIPMVTYHRLYEYLLPKAERAFDRSAAASVSDGYGNEYRMTVDLSFDKNDDGRTITTERLENGKIVSRESYTMYGGAKRPRRVAPSNAELRCRIVLKK